MSIFLRRVTSIQLNLVADQRRELAVALRTLRHKEKAQRRYIDELAQHHANLLPSTTAADLNLADTYTATRGLKNIHWHIAQVRDMADSTRRHRRELQLQQLTTLPPLLGE